MRSQTITGPLVVRAERSAKSSSFVTIIAPLPKAWFQIAMSSALRRFKIVDVLSRIALLRQQACKPGWQLSIDQENHDPTMTTA